MIFIKTLKVLKTFKVFKAEQNFFAEWLPDSSEKHGEGSERWFSAGLVTNSRNRSSKAFTKLTAPRQVIVACES